MSSAVSGLFGGVELLDQQPSSAAFGGGSTHSSNQSYNTTTSRGGGGSTTAAAPAPLLPPGMGGSRFRPLPLGLFTSSGNQSQSQQQQQPQSQTASSPPGATFASHPSPAAVSHSYQQQQRQQQQQQQQQQVMMTPFSVAAGGHHSNINNTYLQQQQQPSVGRSHHHHHHVGGGGIPHIASEVLFASERPGMRPLPDSAYMISGRGSIAETHSSQQRSNQDHVFAIAAEALAQQAATHMSPFTQRLARKMNQTLQVERLPDDNRAMTMDSFFDAEHENSLLQLAAGGGGSGAAAAPAGPAALFGRGAGYSALHPSASAEGAGAGGYGGGGASTPGRRASSTSQPRGGTPTPHRGRSGSGGTTIIGRGGTVSTMGALERNRSGSHGSTRMQIGSFTVEYREPSDRDLQKRIELAAKARKEEINRRTLTRLHRPTAVGSFSEMNPCEPRIVEPGQRDTAAYKAAPLQVTMRVQRSRTPLRQMTRQDFEDARRQHSFTSELRRHSCDVMRRSVNSAALSYVNKHRGVEHTYLSEGAKWFTTPSPRLGIPCRMTIATNEYARHGHASPGPGAYNVPSCFLGR